MAKILIDNNIFLLAKSLLATDFPSRKHVYELGLATSTDQENWEIANREFDALLSKDKDFYYRSILLGSPPKFIGITKGNFSNRQLLSLLRHKIPGTKEFLESEQGILTIA